MAFHNRPASAGFAALLHSYSAGTIGGTFNSTPIVFAPDEAITQIVIGDSEAWLAQPAGNLRFVKPAEARAPTNMQVVTK